MMVMIMILISIIVTITIQFMLCLLLILIAMLSYSYHCYSDVLCQVRQVILRFRHSPLSQIPSLRAMVLPTQWVAWPR